jgi:ABC-type multidrug transport system fused ATPase/permease subunit|tara:strand:+ start:1314 stop:3062 length:1749 start_codon:yes stop_codon:yes gene_type:complete
MLNNEDYSWKQYFGYVWYLLKGRRLRFSIYSALRSAAQVIAFIIAYYFGKIIDFLTSYSSGESLTNFYIYVGLIAFLGAFTVWLRMFSKQGLKTIAANLRKETRLLALQKLVLANMDWHEKEDTGSKIQKINSGSDAIYESLQKFMNEGIGILVGFIGSIVIFFILDWRYLVFSLVFVIIYMLGEHYFNKKLNYWTDELNKVKERVSGKIHESASNILSVKSLGLNSAIHKKTESEEDEFLRVWTIKTDLGQLKFKTIKMFAAVMYALFILMVGFDVINGLITVGSVYVFVIYFGKLKSAMDDFTNKVGGFISVKSRLGRVMMILGLESKDETNLKQFPKNWEKIEFKNVSFKYKDKLVLKNFNLTINRNDKIGLVGRSGSGKSTIIKLLIGLYEPSEGEILVDGRTINHYNSDSVKESISIVLQDSEVFNMSVYDNLTLMQKKKNGNLIKNAVQISELLPIIKRLPQGIDTPIGEKGYQMSGGERQRIGIARALCRDSPIIIFDEATSALDSKTESKIQSALDTKLTNKTTITIAHRLSTLKKSDRIIVLKDGTIVESGHYNQLIRVKGFFYDLYKTQSKK